MRSALIKAIRAVFEKHGYGQFTKATDAVRIKGCSRYGESLAVHQERGDLTLYVRFGGREQVAPLARHLGGVLEDAVAAFRGLDLSGVDRRLGQVTAWLDDQIKGGRMAGTSEVSPRMETGQPERCPMPSSTDAAVPATNQYIKASREHLPCPKVQSILLNALSPCPHFSGACRGVCRWDPASGHIPRGYLGATGRPEEVRLVMVLAEPGAPHDEETYDPSQEREGLLAAFCTHSFACFRDGHDLFHRNQREVIDHCFPGMSLEEQLKCVWMVDAMLCSAPKEGGHVPSRVWRTCVETYLKRQIALFPRAVVASFGHKASTRLSGLDGVLHAKALAPPGCNFAGARESWYEVVNAVRRRSLRSGN